MATARTSVATFDGRPFFDKALRYGVEQEIISPERLRVIQEDFAKGIVQIANYFGTAHLRPELELALQRMVNLISLYLEDKSAGDLRIAAASLRDKSFLSHSKDGAEMLKRLHAMPEYAARGSISEKSQKDFLDDMTNSESISLTDFKLKLVNGQKHQSTINFSIWLAKKMGASANDIDEATALIRSAMLVVFVDKAELKLPTPTAFIRLIKAAKSAKATLNESRLNTFLSDAPSEFQNLSRQEMDHFINNDLPRIRDSNNTADKLREGEILQFFITVSADENVREYVRLVAKEWYRVTHGEDDDPAVLATVFFFVATGLPPKASMLLKEAKEVIRIFRNSGFNSQAVTDFIVNHAPEANRGDLLKFWEEELKSEAEVYLADNDPDFPDSHMERALDYLRKHCSATWKGRGR